ncbi:TIGR03545 family protein [Brucepastera parasyntrophica]|uniref:TIGR03545 family protein n=1 Tax=Brucepastera parasyntrophica TaxID=2880008 RepID=UPI00210A1117|nr:TIGR03545 family protein [Brucepastera parasyntrophica]ULQ59009.1 TIGR03545 family protein [Brucepastera parasyntrophica]
MSTDKEEKKKLQKPQKKEKKPVKVKVPGIFKKKYSEKQFHKKILKKLYVPADKEFIEKIFVLETDEKKNKQFYHVDKTMITSKDEVRKLSKIAKDIKRQKGRINIMAIAAALICVLAVCLVLTVFRNVIARSVITGAMESIFNARCEIKNLDFDILNTKFTMEGVAVADKNQPMKNLFEVGRFELYFNLLALTRGQLVSENLELTGVTWNTDRTKSGALPPREQKKNEEKQKKENPEPNPIMLAIQNELDNVKSAVSVSAGLDAIKEQFDPMAYIEKEKDAMLSPDVIIKITDTVPELTEKWQDRQKDIQAQVNEAIAQGQAVSSLKLDSISTVEEAQEALKTIQSASTTIKDSINLAQQLTKDIDSDAKLVTSLSKEAEAALKADTARLTNVVNSVKSINLETGKNLISDIASTFVMSTLGNYYPYLEQGLAILSEVKNSMQKDETAKETKEKKQSLKKRANALERLPGRTFTYGRLVFPNVHLKNIELSIINAKSGISGGGLLQNVTSDADLVNKPISALVNVAGGGKVLDLSGQVDLRTNAAEPVDASFDFSGYPVNLSSSGQVGVPSVAGILQADGKAVYASGGTISIHSGVDIMSAKVQVEPFDPAFLSEIYQNVLGAIKNIDMDLDVTINTSGSFKLKISSGLDNVIAQSIQAELNRQIDKVRQEITKEINAYIEEQKAAYSSEIDQFNQLVSGAKESLASLQQLDSKLKSEQDQINDRIKQMVEEKTAVYTDAAKEAAAEAAEQAGKKAADALKKLF